MSMLGKASPASNAGTLTPRTETGVIATPPPAAVAPITTAASSAAAPSVMLSDLVTVRWSISAAGAWHILDKAVPVPSSATCAILIRLRLTLPDPCRDHADHVAADPTPAHPARGLGHALAPMMTHAPAPLLSPVVGRAVVEDVRVEIDHQLTALPRALADQPARHDVPAVRDSLGGVHVDVPGILTASWRGGKLLYAHSPLLARAGVPGGQVERPELAW